MNVGQSQSLFLLRRNIEVVGVYDNIEKCFAIGSSLCKAMPSYVCLEYVTDKLVREMLPIMPLDITEGNQVIIENFPVTASELELIYNNNIVCKKEQQRTPVLVSLSDSIDSQGESSNRFRVA